MKDLRHFIENDQTINLDATEKDVVKSFMYSVFGYMFMGLALTGFIAWYFASSGLLIEYFYNAETGQPSPLIYVVMFAPLGLVLWMGLGFNKMSATTMLLVFIAYAAINGVAFSTIFLAYDLGAIYKAFGSASLLFGTMAVVGYTTKTDLTQMGNILRIAVIALIISMVINFFMQISAFDYLISIVGVIIFTGLTAYDVQKLKRIGTGVDMEGASTKKLAIHGALSLYLDFVNLFLFLLRLFGNRD